MNDAARKLASYGRHGDNMLLHVSRKELEGIRSLTGRNFTRNPDTGLPEAFSFADLIPVVAGIAGTVLTGNPLIGAAAAGATSAGKTAIEGGSAQDALISGLVSGATSFAGGQLMSGIGSAVTPAATQAAGSAASGAAGNITSQTAQSLASAGLTGGYDAAVQAGAQAATPVGGFPGMFAGDAARAVIPEVAGSTVAAPSSIGAFPGTVPNAPLSIPNMSAPGMYAGETPGFTDLVSGRVSDFGTRLSNIANDPGAALSQLGTNIYNRPFPALIAGGGMLSQASSMGGQPSMPGEQEYDPNRYPEQFPANPRRFVAPPVGFSPGVSPERLYFAEGGLASLRENDGYTANLVHEAKAALLGEHPRPREAIMRFEEVFGEGALNLLRDRISGGRVRGAGGGMDDLVPGSIEGRQKVRLADGEFVIPSDVVSGLGDGSTDQGVRKLHGLMDDVRQQRTGKKAQPMSIGGKITL
jgi:hypothetical protein